MQISVFYLACVASMRNYEHSLSSSHYEERVFPVQIDCKFIVNPLHCASLISISYIYEYNIIFRKFSSRLTLVIASARKSQKNQPDNVTNKTTTKIANTILEPMMSSAGLISSRKSTFSCDSNRVFISEIIYIKNSEFKCQSVSTHINITLLNRSQK